MFTIDVGKSNLITINTPFYIIQCNAICWNVSNTNNTIIKSIQYQGWGVAQNDNCIGDIWYKSMIFVNK